VEATEVAKVAPQTSAAHGPNASLAKLLKLQHLHQDAHHAMHQCDWISAILTGRCAVSDENNSLKMGYDSENRCWPDWLDRLPVRRDLLPVVVEPGTVLGIISPAVASDLGLPNTTEILAGTTDGVAAFLATGACEIGDAVTSLGSTLVIKLLSDKPIFAPQFGVYSHRLGDYWLVGGASNSGGATLLKYFSREQLDELTPKLSPDIPTGLSYYPLPDIGERFPVSDINKHPELTPRPKDDVRFFQAMIEGMADIEARAYSLLTELGAPTLKSIRTVGGGSRNKAWETIRQNKLNSVFKQTKHLQAAYGTALLASGYINKHFKISYS